MPIIHNDANGNPLPGSSAYGAAAGALSGGPHGSGNGNASNMISPEEALHKAFMQAEQQNEQYRGVDEMHRNQMLQQQLSLFGPVNEMLKRMYGPEFGLDLSKLSTPNFDPSVVQGAALRGAVNPDPSTPESEAMWGSGPGWRGSGYVDNPEPGSPADILSHKPPNSNGFVTATQPKGIR